MILLSPRESLRPFIHTMLVDVAPPLAAYYGLRAVGTSEYVALFSATTLSGLRVLVEAYRSRRLDPFASYLLLTFGLGLAVAVATTDAKTMLIGNTAASGVGGMVFLASCAIGTPLTQAISARSRSAAPENLRQAQRQRRIHVRLSAMWGAGLLVEVVVRITAIETLSVDAATSIVSASSVTALALLALATLIVSRRNMWTDMQ